MKIEEAVRKVLTEDVESIIEEVKKAVGTDHEVEEAVEAPLPSEEAEAEISLDGRVYVRPLEIPGEIFVDTPSSIEACSPRILNMLARCVRTIALVNRCNRRAEVKVE